MRGCGSKSLVERIVVEGDRGQNFQRVLEDAAGHGSIATLGWNELSRVVGSEFIHKEKVGGAGGFAKELDALTDERGDGQQFFGRCRHPAFSKKGSSCALSSVDGQGADMLGVEPNRLGIERVLIRKIDNRVGAVDGFKRECCDQFIQGEKLAVVLG